MIEDADSLLLFKSLDVDFPTVDSCPATTTMPFATMDSFTEPYTRAGDDISLDEVRKQVHQLEEQHRANGIPLSGRIIHVCHYLPVIAALNSRAGVLSPPATPPSKATEVPTTPTTDDVQHDAAIESAAKDSSSSIWTLTSRYGHAAMISGIRSLSATHEQVIVGWTGDIASPVPNENVPSSTISDADKDALNEALLTYQPKESDPDDDRKTSYVPVWLDDKVAHGHYDGYCKQSEWHLPIQPIKLTMSQSSGRFFITCSGKMSPPNMLLPTHIIHSTNPQTQHLLVG